MTSEGPQAEEFSAIRQRLHREQAFFDIEYQQTRLFEKDSYKSVQNLIFLTRKVFSLHLSVVEQAKTGNDVPFIDLSPQNLAPPSGFTATQQRGFQNTITTLIQGNEKFGKTFETFIKEFPEQENYVIFSLIPAILSSLWSQEEISRFLEILKAMSPEIRYSVSRLLLVHPTFFVFLSSIQSDSTKLVRNTESSLSDLLGLIQSRAFLIPSSVRLYIQGYNDPKDIFINSILTPLLINPSIYGLVASTEEMTFERFISDIEKYDSEIENLVNSLSVSSESIQLIPSEALVQISQSSNENQIYMFKQDLSIIASIFPGTQTAPTTAGVYQIPLKRSGPGSRQTKQAAVVEENSLESILRDLVIQLDVSRSGRNIIDTLDSALVLHAGASRLQYELRLDEFKQMKRQQGAPDDVEFYIDLLTNAYEKRMKHRKDTLSNSTTTDVFKVQHLQGLQAAQFLMKTRQSAFFKIWTTTQPFDSVIENSELICTNQKEFSKKYRELIAQFTSFAETKAFNISKDMFVPIIYDKYTQVITLSEFQKHHPELIEKDNRVHRMIEEHREELYEANSLPFLKAFKEQPELMGLAKDHLLRGFDEDSVIPIAEWIDRALNALIHVLSFQGYKEIGADHSIPMTLVLFIHSNPRQICSVASYMHHCLLTLPDNNPVSQSIEYNVTMTHSAGSYFERELQRFEGNK